MVAANVDAVASYAETLARTGLVDAVVLQIGDDTVDDVDPAKTAWMLPLTATLRRLRSEVAAEHVALFAGGTPSAGGIDPAEATWRKIVEFAPRPVFPDDEARGNDALRAAGVPSFDLWSVFRADLASPLHHALLTSDDRHPTPYGRALAARTIAATLLRERPWTPAW